MYCAMCILIIPPPPLRYILFCPLHIYFIFSLAAVPPPPKCKFVVFFHNHLCKRMQIVLNHTVDVGFIPGLMLCLRQGKPGAEVCS